jgi:hypothetical protein
VSFTTGSYPPFANPAIAELAAQLDASLGVANGLSQYLNQSLGEAISANAQIINAVAGAPNVALVTLDHASICYTTAGPLNVTLPSIGGVGRMCEIIKASADSNTITVNTPAGITFVDGTTQFNLYNQNDYVDIICNPANLQWSIRGYRQRGLPVNGGFSGLAGCAAISMNSAGQAAQTITSPTPVVFPIILFDEGLPNPYTIATSTLSFFTAPASGKYLLSAQVPVSATLTSTIGGAVFMSFQINTFHTSTYMLGVTEAFVSATSTTTTIAGAIALSGIVSLTSGDTVAVSLLNQGLAGLQTVTTGGGGLGALGQFSILQVG